MGSNFIIDSIIIIVQVREIYSSTNLYLFINFHEFKIIKHFYRIKSLTPIVIYYTNTYTMYILLYTYIFMNYSHL